LKSREEIMEILEAFDLTGSFRDGGELAGCSHHAVAHWVAKRDAGELPGEPPRFTHEEPRRLGVSCFGTQDDARCGRVFVKTRRGVDILQ
jgi:hypothetical protein